MKICYKTRFIFFSLLFLFFYFGQQIKLIAQEDNKQLTIKVGVYNNSPKVFINTDNVPDGIFIDVIKSIAKTENLQIEYISEDWIQLLSMLKNGEIDVLPDVAFTKERDSLFSLSSIPLLNSWIEIYTKIGTDINSISDLHNKKIGVLEGSIQHECLENILKKDSSLFFKIITYNDYSSSVQSLKKSEVEAIAANRFFYFSDLCDKEILSSGIILQFSDLHFAFPKNKNPNLVKLFDKNILLLRNNPKSAYYESLQRWLDKDYKASIPRFIIWLIIIISSVLLFVSAFALLLQNRVKAKTKMLQLRNEELNIAKRNAEENEQKYRGMVSIMPDGVLIHREGIIIYANPAATKIFKAKSENIVLGRKVLDFVHPEYRDIVINRIKKSIDENISVETIEEILIGFDGKPIYAFVTAFPFLFEGKPSMLVVFTDITNLKLIEKELITSKLKAEESDRLKTVFLQNMSHEIRTPMNGILGFLNLLKTSRLEDERKKYIDIINKSGDRLLNTINNIIEISKIESNQLTVHYSEVNIMEVMDFHLNFFNQQAKEKGLQLKLSEQIRDEKAFTETDKYILDNILTNLICNAIKFTKKGTIEFGNYIEENVMVFYVKDTGAGIPPSRLNAIFERFIQADMKITRPYEGSGLGLSIVKAYVEKLNGKIWVESEINIGSTFYFSIPYIPLKREVINLAEREENVNIPGKLFTILVAEDDEISFLYIKQILKISDIKLLHAKNGKEAIQMLMENPNISLILMDIKMPVMNGLDAARQIRQFNKDIPIIAQTAFALAGDKEMALEAGCNNYITKPINGNKLIQLINEYTLLK